MLPLTTSIKDAVTHTKHLKELNYFVIAVSNDYYCDFKIYRVAGTTCDAEETLVFGPNCEPFHDGLETELTGSVKWDGCSNWDNGDDMLHGCNRQHLIDLGLLLAACWDWAAELIPHWDREVEE